MKIDESNFEEYVLDFIEGNLPLEISEAFQRYLDKNPDLAEEIAQLDQYIMNPPPGISYANKGSLMKPAVGINPWLRRLVRMAAVFLLLMSLYWFIFSDRSSPGSDLTEVPETLINEPIHSTPATAETIEETSGTTAIAEVKKVKEPHISRLNAISDIPITEESEKGMNRLATEKNNNIVETGVAERQMVTVVFLVSEKIHFPATDHPAEIMMPAIGDLVSVVEDHGKKPSLRELLIPEAFRKEGVQTAKDALFPSIFSSNR